MLIKLVVAIMALLGVLVAANRFLRARGTSAVAAGNLHSSATTGLVKASDAASRALCLASITARANLEFELLGEDHSASHEDSKGFAENQRAFMERQGLWGKLSNRERYLLGKTLGSWSTQEIADGQWRAEALAALLWALKTASEPLPYDQESSQLIQDMLPDPESSREFVAQAHLRNSTEIIEARNAAELWLWRARTTQLQMAHTAPPEGITFEKIIAMTAEKAQENGLFTAIDHDFPALGKAYSKLSEDEWETLRSIATERLYALNWLCKHAEDWDQVRTGT